MRISFTQKRFLLPIIMVGIIGILSLAYNEFTRQMQGIENDALNQAQSLNRLFSVSDTLMADEVKASMRLLKDTFGKRMGAPDVQGETLVNGRMVPNLVLGRQALANRFDLVDSVTAVMGGTATIFVKAGGNGEDDFVRISTNVQNDSTRAVGTRLDPKGRAIQYIRAGKPFYGVVEILGTPYFTGYEPMFNARGDIVGAWYVGYKVDLQALRAAVEKTRMLKSGFAAVLDTNDRIRFMSSNIQEKTASAILMQPGRNWILVQQTIPVWGFKVVIAYPRSEALIKSFIGISTSSALFVGVGLLLVAMIAFLLRRFVLNPLGGDPAKVVQLVQSISNGKLDEDDQTAREGSLMSHVLRMRRDLRNMLDKLNAQKKFLNTILENEPECVKVVSVDGTLLQMNRAGLAMLESDSFEEVQQNGLAYYILPEFRAAFMALHNSVCAGYTGQLEFQVIGRNGGVRWLDTKATPLHDDDGKITALLGVTRDITERKQAEAREHHLTQLYQALSEVNQAIVRMGQESELFPLVCRCAVEFGGMKMAWVGRLDEGSGHITRAASYGSGQGYLDETFFSARADIPEGRGPSGTALRENRTVIVNDFKHESTLIFKQRAAKYGLHSGASFPIQRNGKPFAMLTVYHDKTGTFDTAVIALLEEMAKDIAFALDNFDREMQRKAAEESLRLAASVYETSSEAMTVTDADGIILTVNPAFTKVTGYMPREVIGRNSRMLGSLRHDEAFYQALWQEIVTTGHWHGEIWDKRKNGEEYAIWLTINTIYNEDGSAHRRVSLFSDITEWKNTQELIWQQANFDPMTGLPNRQMFHDRMDQEIKKSHRAGLPMALLFLDLDRFKEVNDTLGHDMGDVLLKETAQRLTSCVRETDTVARLGGDEFTIILGELDETRNVERVIQDILLRLSEPFQLGNEIAYISASIGITLYPNDATTADELLKNADQAMYAAKNQGRNRYHYFTQSMQQTAQVRLRLTNDLRKALAAKQFRVYYQPIVDLLTGETRKAEALIRWQHPKLGLIGPVQFIPIAEETGLIIDIGEWVFHQAAAQAGLWRKSHHPEFQISVNRSPVQFHNEDKNRPSWILHLDRLKLPGQSIVVEITEGLLLETSTGVTDRLQEFRDAGIQVSLDDFGTGYSSLSYLNKFDIDFLKIDQSFVRDLSPGSSNMALCEAIIVMAHKLGMKVIAEGIETEQQYRLLTAAGCDYGQGFLFSKPLPAEQFADFLMRDQLSVIST